MTKPEREPMSLARFDEILAAYGGDRRRWPQTERVAAEALLATSEAARASWAEAQALDGVLDAYALAPAPAQLRARVLEVPARAARGKRQFGWRLAWAVALSCLIGVVSGAFSAEEVSADDEVWSEITAASFYPDLSEDDSVSEPAVSSEEVP